MERHEGAVSPDRDEGVEGVDAEVRPLRDGGHAKAADTPAPAVVLDLDVARSAIDAGGQTDEGACVWTESGGRIAPSESGLPLRALLEALCEQDLVVLRLQSLEAVCVREDVREMLRNMPRRLTVEALGRRFESHKRLHEAMLRLAVAMLAPQRPEP